MTKFIFKYSQRKSSRTHLLFKNTWENLTDTRGVISQNYAAIFEAQNNYYLVERVLGKGLARENLRGAESPECEK